MKKTSLAVSLQNLTKKYELYHEKPTFVENVFRKKNEEIFTALKGISFDIKQGEKIGIVGANGSGKTTLLKIIAGITQPTIGKVITKGKIVSLINLEAGMHPDLTGEENIFLNGLLTGMTKIQIKEKFSQIVDFADIGQFIDSPLYTYSWGMKLRLGFSVAIHSEPDILLLDEGIVVGDEFFRQKAIKPIQALVDQGKTVILATHWLEWLKSYCERIIWLDQGKVRADGQTEIIELYKKSR